MLEAEKIAPTFRYEVVCTRADGTQRWKEDFTNLVTTEGKNDLLTQYFKGAGYTAAWYCGVITLTGYTGVAAGDTSAAHAGWVESVKYAEATRPSVTWGSAAAGSLATSSAAVFTINDTDTLTGGFVISENTKSGTTGVLYSAGLFTTGDRSVLAGDVVSMSISMSA